MRLRRWCEAETEGETLLTLMLNEAGSSAMHFVISTIAAFPSKFIVGVPFSVLDTRDSGGFSKSPGA
jgi:hypothetical protein